MVIDSQWTVPDIDGWSECVGSYFVCEFIILRILIPYSSSEQQAEVETIQS